MGDSLQSLQIAQAGGEILKSKYYQYIVRVLILLGTSTSVAFLLLAWTQSLDLESLALPWDRNPFGAFSSPETIVKNGETAPSSQQPKIRTGTEESATDVFRKRGVGLLHAWTDSELFVRALTNEKIGAGQNNSSSVRTPKIAFMFLIQNDIPFEPLWNNFFKGHEGLFNIYVHIWPLKLSAFQRSKGVFWGRLVPSQEGQKLTPGLIANARRLLANALLDDPSNEWFALISGSCIPLHGFRHVYDTLASTNKSFLDIDPEHWDMWNRYTARGDDAMKPEIQFSQFKVGSQFWVMRRKHAVMTVDDMKYWTKFNKPCLPNHVYCYPEEHYFSTMMGFLDPGGCKHTATLVDWSRAEGGHPTRWEANEISLNFLIELRQRGNGEYLFARKFHRDCLDKLLDTANELWAE
ncbi:unnamed protein product [Calypogeia fissa]